MKKLLSVLLAAALIFSFGLCAVAQNESTGLSFGEDGTFRILHLTDTQDDAYPSPDMLNLLKKAIEFSQPDLIVFTGDLIEDSRPVLDFGSDLRPFNDGVVVKKINGKMDEAATKKNVEKAVDAVLSVFESYEIPYCIALGNNDRKVGMSSSDWLELFAAYPHCVIFDESADAADGIDYHLPVKGNDGSNKLNLWLMDTGLKGISDEQVEWYHGASSSLAEENGGKPVPAIVFQHIQDATIGNLFEPCKATDTGARKGKGGWFRLDGEKASGYNLSAYAPCEPTYEFSAWKESGDVMAVFFGHQHVEGFSGVCDGIELGFTYGCEMAKTGPYGFRTITLNENDVTAYETKLYRYTGKMLMGNSGIAEEGAYLSSIPSVAKSALDFFLKVISLFTGLS